MKIAKEGYPFIVVFALLGLLFRRTSRLFSWLFYVMAGFSAFFFRDPERVTPEDENSLISPADGVVIAIDDCDENEYINGPAKKIAIFMSVFNVHINRAPIHGTVGLVKYRQGKFDAAFKENASFENEMNMVGMENSKTKVLVKQIAGVLARRIVCDVVPGDMLGQGDRFGLIKFGSRVELIVPAGENLEIMVSLMDKVTGGETVIARMK